ncbi:ribonuclease P protein component [Candidatus Falkowbacteria bacterium]|nr:ribonuclease P protein component [Candidatus Falkowbacteria bacterium]
MLQKRYRITKQKEFDRFFGQAFKKIRGQSAAGGIFVVKTIKNNLTFCRFGFVVPNTIDKRATARNRIKRQLREIVRTKMKEFRPGFDVLVIVKTAIKGKGRPQIEDELLKLFNGLSVI